MLYIPLTKDGFGLLVEAAKDLGVTECVFWPIGDSVFTVSSKILSDCLREDTKERVTSYDDNNIALVSVYDVSVAELAAKAEGGFDEIEKNFDSIAFYKPGELSWILCYIFHERMAVAKHDKLASVFEAYKLPYSPVSPDYW